jgi:hypothetical protein
MNSLFFKTFKANLTGTNIPIVISITFGKEYNFVNLDGMSETKYSEGTARTGFVVWRPDDKPNTMPTLMITIDQEYLEILNKQLGF